MIRGVHVYARRSIIMVVALSVTTDGLGLETDPRLRLDATVSDTDLGAAVQSALAQSGKTIPPPDWKVAPLPGKRTAEVAGLKSWASFARGARLAQVESDDNRIIFRPTMNKGANSGFEPHPADLALTEQSPSYSDIGATIRRAFQRCE